MAKYQNPQYMGFDRVFVHLVDNYFLKEDVLNTTASINEKLKERSDKLKPLLIGEPAPDLLLIDTNDRFVSFRDFESDFTVLLFWDYNCNVCEDEIAELQSLIDTTIYNISVYAINTNRNIDQWKDVVSLRNMNWYHVNGTKSMTANFYNLYDINGTPRLFLLDDEKKIIAKHFKVAQLIPIIENQFMKSKL
jgi:peroxiredoxin